MPHNDMKIIKHVYKLDFNYTMNGGTVTSVYSLDYMGGISGTCNDIFYLVKFSYTSFPPKVDGK